MPRCFVPSLNTSVTVVYRLSKDWPKPDRDLGSDLEVLRHSNVRHIHALNPNYEVVPADLHGKLSAWPLGPHKPVTAVQILKRLSRRPPRRSRLLFAGPMEMSYEPRKVAFRALSRNKWELHNKMRLNASEYFHAFMESKFVVSPPGFGRQCRREWEALLSGAIPVREAWLGLERLYEV